MEYWVREVGNRADLRLVRSHPNFWNGSKSIFRLQYHQIFNTIVYFAPSLASTALGMLYSRITASCLRKPHNSRWMK